MEQIINYTSKSYYRINHPVFSPSGDEVSFLAIKKSIFGTEVPYLVKGDIELKYSYNLIYSGIKNSFAYITDDYDSSKDIIVNRNGWRKAFFKNNSNSYIAHFFSSKNQYALLQSNEFYLNDVLIENDLDERNTGGREFIFLEDGYSYVYKKNVDGLEGIFKNGNLVSTHNGEVKFLKEGKDGCINFLEFQNQKISTLHINCSKKEIKGRIIDGFKQSFDKNSYAYQISINDNETYIIKDGERLFEQCYGFCFAKNTSDYAFIKVRNINNHYEFCLVINGIEKAWQRDPIINFSFSPNGKNFSYVTDDIAYDWKKASGIIHDSGFNRKSRKVFRDGVIITGYTYSDLPFYSNDGSLFGFVVKSGSGERIIILNN